jgi:hypothetical protein
MVELLIKGVCFYKIDNATRKEFILEEKEDDIYVN